MNRSWPWPEQPPLVLAVDDQEPSLRVIGQMLAGGGCDVMPAESGERALQRLSAATPDVVVLDLRMRPLDGVEVLRRIRAKPEWQGLAVLVMVPMHERGSTTARVLAAGADDTLSKPVQESELLARVRLHAELQRRRQAA